MAAHLPIAGPSMSELVHQNGAAKGGYDFGGLNGHNRDTAVYSKGYQEGYRAGKRERQQPITVTAAYQKGMAYGYSKAKGEHNATLRRVVQHMSRMLWSLRGELKAGKLKRTKGEK